MVEDTVSIPIDATIANIDAAVLLIINLIKRLLLY
jgi:hypothetical protein